MDVCGLDGVKKYDRQREKQDNSRSRISAFTHGKVHRNMISNQNTKWGKIENRFLSSAVLNVWIKPTSVQ